MRIEVLTEYRFTQAEVLKLLPELPVKTLQNWAHRELLDGGIIEGRSASKVRRKYSALSLIMLAIMQQMSRMGIGPFVARDMTYGLVPQILEIWASRPGRPFVLIGKPSSYSRLVIWRDRDLYRTQFNATPETMARLARRPTIYTTIEVDLIAADIVHRIRRHSEEQST
jgi:hypothetical protein